MYNFNLIKDRLGDTVHVRELDGPDYPYQRLFDLMAGIDYSGWVLLECRTEPNDRLAALAGQRDLFQEMMAKARPST